MSVYFIPKKILNSANFIELHFQEWSERTMQQNSAQVLIFQYYEKPIGEFTMWSKLEIDPATMGDQGIYACVANNEFGVMAKNFKAEFTY